MRLQFFSIPVHDATQGAEDLNRFLASHRILKIDRELIQDGANSCWAVCVGFVEEGAAKPTGSKKSRIDYREVLSDSDFAVFANLRSLRKELSEREGVPPYALFTNEQLASMVTRRVTSLAGLREIDGVGPSRIEKYGAAFLEVLKTRTDPPQNTDNNSDNDETKRDQR